VLPRRVGEAPVTAFRRDATAADRDAHEFGARVDRGRDGGAGFDRDALAEPAERGGDLPAAQAHERVRAEHRWVVTVERGVAHRSAIPPSTTRTCPVA
jgi:hypothetical protein